MEKPEELFDRDREWQALWAFAADGRPGAKLAVVRGRRRHGKSVLLRALVDAGGGFYHQALEGTAAEQLRDLGAAIAARAGLPAALALPDWTAAVDALIGEQAVVESPVVLDEFSYLVAADASLPSTLQRALDERVPRGPSTRLVVCGSALSIMSSILVGSAPLRGRATVELPVRAFDYREAAAFQGTTDPRVAAQVYAVIGGVPGYSADLLDGDLPRTLADFDDWVVRAAVGRASAALRGAPPRRRPRRAGPLGLPQRARRPGGGRDHERTGRAAPAPQLDGGRAAAADPRRPGARRPARRPAARAPADVGGAGPAPAALGKRAAAGLDPPGAGPGRRDVAGRGRALADPDPRARGRGPRSGCGRVGSRRASAACGR